MYYKERENSALYKYYRQEEQARHTRKLEEIKTRKLKHAPSENTLPPITHRPHQPKPFQKAQLEAETERLSKRILKLKTNRSDYFSKVIGLNLSGEWRRKDRAEDKERSVL